MASLITLTQGGLSTSGEALLGVTGVSVVVGNADNTGIEAWEVRLADVPTTSTLTPGTLASGLATNPAAAFTPDVSGSYRIVLTTTVAGVQDTDIRVFSVSTGRGHILPPYQKNPDPLPITGSGQAGAKPGELNFGGQLRGWAGTAGLLDSFMRTYADSPGVTLTGVNVLGSETAALYVANTTGGDVTVALPSTAREGTRIEFVAYGNASNRLTINPSAGVTLQPSTLFPANYLVVSEGGSCCVVRRGSSWIVLGAKQNVYERTILGGLASTDQTGYVALGTVDFDPSVFVNIRSITFQAIVETTDSLSPAEVRLYNYTAASQVAGSVLQTTSLGPALVSASVTLPAGSNIYEAQLRLTGAGTSDRVSCKQARLLVDWVQS